MRASQRRIVVAGDRDGTGDNRYEGLGATFPGLGVDIGVNRVATWYSFDVRTDGLVWRFRYPVDPAIAVVAAAGLAMPLALAWSAASRYRLARDRPPETGLGSDLATGSDTIAAGSEGDSDARSHERGAGRRRIDGVVPR